MTATSRRISPVTKIVSAVRAVITARKTDGVPVVGIFQGLLDRPARAQLRTLHDRLTAAGLVTVEVTPVPFAGVRGPGELGLRPGILVNVSPATSGDALRVAARHRIPVVVCDDQPRVGGTDTAWPACRPVLRAERPDGRNDVALEQLHLAPHTPGGRLDVLLDGRRLRVPPAGLRIVRQADSMSCEFGEGSGVHLGVTPPAGVVSTAAIPARWIEIRPRWGSYLVTRDGLACGQLDTALHVSTASDRLTVYSANLHTSQNLAAAPEPGSRTSTERPRP